MSVNSIDIKDFQRVLDMIVSDPPAVLMLEPNRAVLSISGEFAWTIYGPSNIARVLCRTVEKFHSQDTDDPVVIR